MRRLLSFFKQWWYLVAIGDTWAARLVRWIGYIAVVVLVAGLPVSQQQAWLYVEIIPGLALRWATSPERLTLAILVFAYVLITLGAAWVRSNGPTLTVAALLEEDADTLVFRLRVGINGSGTAEPIALVESIVDDQGQPILAAQMPVELQWSNHPAGERPKLSRHVTATVGVAVARDLPIKILGGPPQEPMPIGLRIHGMYHAPEVDTLLRGGNRRVAIRVIVSTRQTSDAETRWFGFTPDPHAPMLYTAATLSVDRRSGLPIWPVEATR